MKTLGIDLGTANSLVAIDGEIQAISDGTESFSYLPSVVSFLPTGATVVGTSARQRRAIDPTNTIFSSKRIIGRAWHAYETSRFRERYPFNLKNTADGPVFATRAGQYTPSEIAGTVLRHLLSQCGIDPDGYHAVVAVPAEFESAQHDATVKACQHAGLDHVTIVDEPIATARAYEHAGHDGKRFRIVYDLGGGTFDLAILEYRDGTGRVVHHVGDTYLGGDDIDYTLAHWVAREILEAHHWDLKTDPQTFDRLIAEAEQAKIRLCITPQTRIELSQVDAIAPCAVENIIIPRTQLDAICTTYLQRTFAICDQAMSDAGITRDDVDSVYLAGGTTLIPVVRRGIADYFGKAPSTAYDPMEVVAIGASLSDPTSTGSL